MEETTRKIVAILFSDIAGYTAAMGQDEEAAIRAVSRSRSVQRELVRKYHGDWVQEVGDGALCTFASAVEAVTCAVEIQRAFEGESDFKLRIGIHVGDIVFRKTESGYDVFGDGVNVAARVQGVSEEGGICVSDRVYDELRNRKLIDVRYLGEHQLKNVNRPIGVYAVIDPQRPGAAAALPAPQAASPKRRTPLLAALGLLAAAGIAVLLWSWQGRTPPESVAPPPPPAAVKPEPAPKVAPAPQAAPELEQPRPEPVPAQAPAKPSAAEAPAAKAPAVAPPAAPQRPKPAAASAAFDSLRRALLARVGPWGEARARVETDPNPVPNEEKYKIVFEAQCDCEAMLFAVDGSKDEIALLYPNPYDPSRRLAPGERRSLPGTAAYSFRAVGGEGVDMIKLFVTPKQFRFPEASVKSWEATPATPERMAELSRWLDSLEKIPFATSVTPLQIRR